MHSLLLGFATVFVISHSAASAAQTSRVWTHESEVGIAVTGGNTDTQSYNAKQTTAFQWKKKNKLTLSGRLFYGSDSGTVIARNWEALLRYDRKLTSRFGLFLSNLWEADPFAGYRYRTSIDAGAQYAIIPGEENYLINETGYRYTYEQPVGNNPVSIGHFIRIYFEAQKRLSRSATVKLWIELLPDVADSDNYQANFEPSIKVSMTDHLALKAAYTGKYDNSPPKKGSENFDYRYTTSLIASF